MANRKEEKERLRRLRLEAEQREAAEQRRKLMVGYGIAGLLGAAVVVGLVVVLLSSGGGGASGGGHINAITGSTNGLPPDEREGPVPPPLEGASLTEAARAAGAVLREDLPIEGRSHLPPDSELPDYKTNPPTSGNHVEPPFQQADGAYLKPASQLNVVHSLEHGRIAVQYSPDLPEKAQLELRGLYDTMYGGALLFPNPDMPYEVAVTAWGKLIGFKKYEGARTLDAIRLFGIEHWGQGPEDVTAFGPLDEATPGTPAGTG